jgi:uncharacterized membrane protein YfcA
MFGHDPATLALIAATLVAGGIVKGVTGLGLPMVALGVLTLFLPVPLVLAVIVSPIVITNLWQAIQSGNPMEPVRRFWPMILAICAFLWMGARLVVALTPAALYAMIGISVVLFSAASFVHPGFVLPPRFERGAGVLAGAVGGLLGGVSTLLGPPVVMYFLALDMPKETFIRAIGLVYFAGSIPLVLAYVDNGILNAATAPLSAAACVPTMAGLALGARLRRLFDQRVFRNAVLIVFCALGLNLIRRAIF